MNTVTTPTAEAINREHRLASNRCLCRTCGECFNSPSAFDAHRVGEHAYDRRCLARDAMRRALARGAAMTRQRIGGPLGLDALDALAGTVTDDDYIRRAQANRPDDDGIRAEALRLFHSGLTAADIAQALRVDLATAQTWIARGTS